MSIWITRSEPGATTLAESLERAGFKPFKAPVLSIEPVAFEPPGGRFDAAVFLSAHGVRLAAQTLKGRFRRAFAVGRRTRQVLLESGVEAAAAEVESSEGLLADLPGLAGQRVLLVSGVGGRNVLGAGLERRGVEVERLEVYRRVPASPLIDCARIDAAVASSGDGFRQAARVWFAAGGAPGLSVLVPSARVGALGPELGLANVVECAGADSRAVLAALRSMQGSA
ncbi:MAG: uroporphyrinogen-III synthase [Gammaproteobacteria bacterium]|nr:uroporphyrinogen-III synthase [Gammaproteobacteria bacterium]